MRRILIVAAIFCALGNTAFAVMTIGCQEQPWFIERVNASESGASVDELAIRHVFGEYSSAIEEGDGERWIALWDTDGVQLPPDAPMVVGKPAIWNGAKAEFGTLDIKMWITVQETVVFGQLGYARGVYGFAGNVKNGGPALSYDGKFLTVLRKQQDGRWLIYRDIFNSNLPVQ
jgi:uncharacterized protein (TIGR02246 family)